jgi:hypothetical protein
MCRLTSVIALSSFISEGGHDGWHEAYRRLSTLHCCNSKLLLRRCHEAFDRGSKTVKGFIALSRGSFHRRSATRNRCILRRPRLAEPGQKWNATDVITDPNLPDKRLIWATVGGEYYVVHYERGGIAHTFHVLVAKLAKNDAKPKVIWRGLGGPLKDYAAFLIALRNGKLDDRLDYAH